MLVFYNHRHNQAFQFFILVLLYHEFLTGETLKGNHSNGSAYKNFQQVCSLLFYAMCEASYKT